MIQKLEGLNSKVESYRIRQISLIILDTLIVLLSSVISIKLTETYFQIPILIYVAINILSFYKFNCYSSLWSCGGEKEITNIFMAGSNRTNSRI